MSVRAMKDFRIETAPEGVCPECLKRLGTGLVVYERDWRMYGSTQEWHTEHVLGAAIELIVACRLTAEVQDTRGDCHLAGVAARRRSVIWKPGDELKVAPHPGGSHHMWRVLAPESGSLPDRDLKHIVIENGSRKGGNVAMLCALDAYRLTTTPADVLLARLQAEHAADVQAEADEKAVVERKRRAEREAQWRAQVADHMAGESIKSVAALLSTRRDVAAVGACAHFGNERTVRLAAADAIKLALVGYHDLGKLAVVLSADDYASGDEADALREPIVKIELKRDDASLLAMAWSAREGVPIAAVAMIVRAIFDAGVPRASLVEDDSLEKIAGRDLASRLLAEINAFRAWEANDVLASSVAVTPNGTVLGS